MVVKQHSNDYYIKQYITCCIRITFQIYTVILDFICKKQNKNIEGTVNVVRQKEHRMGNEKHGNLFIFGLKVNKQHTKPKTFLLPHLQKWQDLCRCVTPHPLSLTHTHTQTWHAHTNSINTVITQFLFSWEEQFWLLFIKILFKFHLI